MEDTILSRKNARIGAARADEKRAAARAVEARRNRRAFAINHGYLARESHPFDRSRVQSLGPLLKLELDGFVGLERLESIFEDRAIVDEDVFIDVLHANEAVSLCVIEPFYGAIFCHNVVLCP